MTKLCILPQITIHLLLKQESIDEVLLITCDSLQREYHKPYGPPTFSHMNGAAT